MPRSTGAAAHARASSLMCRLAGVGFVGTCSIIPTTTTAFQLSMARPAVVADSSTTVRAFGAAQASGGAGTRRGRRSSRPNWWALGSSPVATAVQDSPPATEKLGQGFDRAQISDVLEHEYRADLVRLAAKYGELIESAEDVETISIMELDG